MDSVSGREGVDAPLTNCDVSISQKEYEEPLAMQEPPFLILVCRISFRYFPVICLLYDNVQSSEGTSSI